MRNSRFIPVVYAFACLCIVSPLMALTVAETLNEAHRAYLSGDSQRAGELLASAVSSDSLEIASVELMKGAIAATAYFDAGAGENRDAAERHFSTALRLDPFVDMIEGDYPGRVIGLFRVKRSEMIPGERVDIAASSTTDVHESLERAVTSQAEVYLAPLPPSMMTMIISTPGQFITTYRSVVDAAGNDKRTTVQVIVNVDSIAGLASDSLVILDKIKQPTLMVDVAENIAGSSGSTTRIIESGLVDYFTALGFRVFDKSKGDHSSVDIVLSGDATADAHEEKLFGATIMAGQASVQTRLTWISTGKNIAAENLSSATEAAGESATKAAEKSLQKLADELAPRLAARCIENWNDAQVNGRDILIEITNAPLARAQALIDQLRIVSEARGISEPEFDRKEASGSVKVYVQSKVPAHEIGQRIELGLVGFNVKVLSVDIARIQLEVL